MITRNELAGYISKVRLQNIQQVETDYLQHIALSSIYSGKSRIGSLLVFKGGTALQKLQVVDRFSIDLDFTTSSKIDEKGLEELAHDIKDGLEGYGYASEYAIEPGDDSANVVLHIKGPIFIDHKSLHSIATLKLNISKRESVTLDPVFFKILPAYLDIAPYAIKHMAYNEMLAEKVRAILTRKKARDLYDLFIMLKRGFLLDLSIIRKKLLVVGKKQVTANEILDNARALRGVWNQELNNLMFAGSGIPEYDYVIKTLESTLLNNVLLSFEFDMDNGSAYVIHKDKGQIFSARKCYFLHYAPEAKEDKAAKGYNGEPIEGFYTPFDGTLNVFSDYKYNQLYPIITVDGNEIISAIFSLEQLYADDNSAKGTYYLAPNSSFIRKWHNLSIQIFCEGGKMHKGNVALSGVFSKAGIKEELENLSGLALGVHESKVKSNSKFGESRPS